MGKKVLVTGATGQQGGLVARELLKLGHSVRAFVRDTDSDRSEELVSLGATLAQGNFNDSASIDAAMEDVDSVFIVSMMYEGIENEIAHGKSVVDAAVKNSVEHIVYSSVAGAADNTGIAHFDSKYEVEIHLTTMAKNWTIVAPVFFMENLSFPWNLSDIANGKIRQALSADTSLQLITSADIGRFVAHVIDRGQPLYGRRIEIAGDSLTGPEIASVLSEAIGKPVKFEVQSKAEVDAIFEGVSIMYEWLEKTGYNTPIEDLRSEFGDIDWTSFKDWAQKQDWTAPLDSVTTAV